jgi:hypothetical protein
MSSRITVALGIGALLLILLGTLMEGSAIGFYVAAGATVVVAIVLAIIRHRHDEPPGDAVTGG